MLKNGPKLGLGVTIVPEVVNGEQAISSTRNARSPMEGRKLPGTLPHYERCEGHGKVARFPRRT